MAQAQPHIHSFCTGEYSIDALARVDQEKTALAAQIQENILPFVIGKGMMRPGTQYLGASPSGNQVREIPFLKSVVPYALAGLELSNAALRVWVNDALVTRPSVGTAITNGTLATSTGWTVTNTGGGLATFNSFGLLLILPNRGGSITVDQQVTVASGDRGILHALRLSIGLGGATPSQGPVMFQVGSTQGASDYVAVTSLDTGWHSLAFTPTGNFWVRFSTVLDRNVVVNSIAVESAGVMSLPAPWATADLGAIQFAQSGDVVFLAHPNWQQQRIERRGTYSWSLVLFKANDGPFALPGAADTAITLTPSVAYGNGTLTASAPLFAATDVGALLSVDSTGYNATFSLAGVGVFTEPIRIHGLEPDTQFTIVVSGTFVGTLQLYKSIEGPDTGFVAASGANSSFTTANSGATYDPGTLMNNVVMWFRVGFSAYTSGAVQITMVSGVTTGPTGPGGSPGSTGAAVGVTGTGIYRITGYVSQTVANVEVLKYPTSLSPSNQWQRGLWSGTNGWPTAVGLHDGRLWFGVAGLPTGSVSEDFTSFATEEESTTGAFSVTDDASIQRAIGIDGAVYNINWICSLTRLAIGTDGAELSVYADGFDAALTPTNQQIKASSGIGSTPVSPVVFDKEAFYVSRTGNRLFKLTYTAGQYGYDSDDLTEMNVGIGTGGMTQIAVARNPEPWVFIVRGDGQCLVLLYSVKHKIMGWFRILSPGSSGTDAIESVAVYPGTTTDTQDRVYFWVKRTINNTVFRFREKLCLNSEAIGSATTKLLDSGAFFAGPASSVAAGSHLAGCTVYAWANGTQLGPITADGSGNVALGGTYTNIWVGLGYTGRYQSAKLAYGVQSGTALLKPKIVEEIGILASNVLPTGVRYGKDFTTLSADGKPMWPVVTSEIDPAGVLPVMEDVAFPFDSDWSTDSRVCITINPNTPCTLNGLVVTMRTNEG